MHAIAQNLYRGLRWKFNPKETKLTAYVGTWNNYGIDTETCINIPNFNYL